MIRNNLTSLTKGLLIAAALIATALLALRGVAGVRTVDKDDMASTTQLSEEEMVLFFDRFCRLANNADRSIEEYVLSDESTDTLLWSKERTEQELIDMLSEELKRRHLWHATTELDGVRYEGRVRRWRYTIHTETTGYRALLKVMQQAARDYDRLAELHHQELEQAIEAGFYRDALMMIEWEAKREDKNIFRDYIDLFAGQPEQLMLRLLDLRERYRYTVLPLQNERKVADWLREEAKIYRELEELRSHFEENFYKVRLRDIADHILTYSPSIESVSFIDLHTGEIRLRVEGPTRQSLTLYLLDGEESPKAAIRTGNAQKVGTFDVEKGKARWLSEELTLRLPKVGFYTLALKGGGSEIVATRNIRYEQVVPRLAGQTVYALDRQDGSPVGGVEVRVFRGDKRRRPDFTLSTDSHGEAVIREQAPRGSYLFVEVTDPRMAESRYFTIYGEPEIEERPIIDEKEVHEVSFYTDRPIYRRSQEVRVGLVSTTRQGAERRVEPNDILTVELRGYRNGVEEKIAKQQVTTDERGVAETSFRLPKDEDLGNYYLSSGDSRQRLEVEDYKLMHLTVTIDSIPTGYVCGKPMRVYGRTEDINGHPVSARLTLQYDVDGKRITGESGPDGRFLIETKPLTDDPYGGRYYNHPLILSAADALGDVDELTMAMDKDTTNLPLSASAALGGERFINRLALKLSTETQPYHRLPLGDLSPYHITAVLEDLEGKAVIDPIRLGMSEERTLRLSDLPSGSYRLRLSTRDYWDREVTETSEPLYLYSPDDTELYGEVPLLLTRTDKGEILYGSTYGGTLSLTTTEADGEEHHRFIPIEPGQVYRLSPREDAVRLELTSFHIGQESSLYLDLGDDSDDEEQRNTAHTDGLSMKDEKALIPGDSFSRTFTVLGKDDLPLANTPVLVTVYDQALAEAANEETHWERIGGYHYPELRYEAELEIGSPMVLASQSMRMSKALGSDNAVAKVADMDQSIGSVPVSERPTLRRNFAETAYFNALLRTDAQGKVKLDFKLPDTQTKYILEVYSFTPDFADEILEDHRFSVFAPLSVELSLPRYLRWGDRLEGLARVQSTGDASVTVPVSISREGKELAHDRLQIAAGETATTAFTLEPKRIDGDSIVLHATASGDGYTDALERVLPLRSDLTEYNVAVPFSLYKESEVTLTLPKMDRSSQQAVMEIYFSPMHLLLTTLADEYAIREEPEELWLVEASTQYAVYSELRHFIHANPSLRRSLSMARTQLRAAIRDREAEARSSLRRQADPKTLADFYDFLLSEEQMADLIGRLEERVLSFAFPDGGYRYDRLVPEPSPWLTHAVLDQLSYAPDRSSEMERSIDRSLDFLERELDRKRSFYSAAMDYRLLAHKLGRTETHLTGRAKELLETQVKSAKEYYQTASTSYLLRYADYARIFESREVYAPVEKFIRDRSQHTESDGELLSLTLFLLDEKEEGPLSPEVTRFFLELKQGTLWSDPMALRAIEPLLETITPTRFEEGATLRVGKYAYHPTALDKATGHIVLGVPEPESRTAISWSGITTDFAFGGVRYVVSEPAREATPTGEKLTVSKEIYARRIVDGESTLVRLTESKEAHTGERLVVRYLIETQQDLSLVTLRDDRAAGAEPGYDFAGYGMSDRTWYSYSRRETADYIFIDYLPRGKHVLELEATANVAGDFGYGPAEVQSFYAPEYAGNSAGGSLRISHK